MGKFKDRNFGRRDSDRRQGGDRFRSDRHDSDFKRSFRVTCDKCGETCEVPFRPTGDKPVYCSDCYRKNSKSTPKRFEENNFKAPRSEVTREDIDAINEKLDLILESLNIKRAKGDVPYGALAEETET